MRKRIALWPVVGSLSLSVSLPVSATSFDQSFSAYGLSLGALLATLAVLLIQFNSQRSTSTLLVALASLLTIVMMIFPVDSLITWSLWGGIFLIQSMAHFKLYQEVPTRRPFIFLASAILVLCAISEYMIAVGMAWLALPMLLSAVVCFGDGWNEYSALIEQLEQQKRNNERQTLEAEQDVVTGLPNLMRFERLGNGFIRNRSMDKFSLLLIRLGNFEQINQTLGHSNGDLMLAQAGQRIQNRLKSLEAALAIDQQEGVKIKVANLGGVNFGVFINTGDKNYLVQKIAKEFTDGLMEPLVLQSCALEFGVSAGIACYPDHGLSVSELINHAHDAIIAVDKGASDSALYSSKYELHGNENIVLMEQLRDAINNDELLLHVQPVIDLNSGEVTAGEIFVRWRHPQKGLIQPDDFVELAEQTGVIFALTQWVLAQAVKQLKAMQDAGLNQRLSINIGNSDLLHIELIETMEILAEQQQVDLSHLILEIKESALLDEPDRALEMMIQVNQRNIGISLDDFGTGYTSLSYLRKLPICEVKIDGSFVANVECANANIAVIGAIIDIARKMELDVVAEGVEDAKVAGKLKGMGCSKAQGFYYSRPFELEGFTSWVQQWQKNNQD